MERVGRGRPDDERDRDNTEQELKKREERFVGEG